MKVVIIGGTAALIDEAAAIAGASATQRTAVGVWRLEAPAMHAARRVRLCDLCESARADVFLIDMPRALTSMKLAVMDMDSTLITIECIDEIADMQGLKPQVSAITAAAMRGELDYAASLKRRVALLQGLEVDGLERVYRERLRLSPGAETMLAAFRTAGLKTLLVSGGFTFFTSRLQQRLGIDYTASNTLGIESGRLTGEVLGEIVDAEVKRRTLIETCARIGCMPAEAIVIGDGANDLKMMGAAGISIAYLAKPVVRAQATHAINHNGLDAVLSVFD